MKLEFGIPKQRQRKEDRFKGQNVLIIHPEPEVKGASRKFELSQDAANAMNYEDGGKIAVSFIDGKMYLAHLRTEIPSDYVFTKTNTFSNGKLYEYVAKTFDVDTSKENVYNLKEVSIDAVEDANVISLMEVVFQEETEEQSSINNEENDNHQIDEDDYMEKALEVDFVDSHHSINQ